MGEYLAEIPEAEAEGRVAVVYADIRRTLGVPFVQLVYRALATEPGRLERLWHELVPNIASDTARRGAAELGEFSVGDVAPIPRPSLALVALDRRQAAATLAYYRRANSANLIGLQALLQGVEGPPATGIAAPGNQPEEAMLPMASLDRLPAATIQLLETISAPITGAREPILIPSLLRHFAHDPGLLGLLWAALRPALTSSTLLATVGELLARASEIATTLPYRATKLSDTQTCAIVERFLRTIPAMIITGSLIEQALSEALADPGR